MLDVAVVLGVLVLILAAILVARSLPWASHARDARTAIDRFDAMLAQYRERQGHLPGDANRDGEIDAIEASYVAHDLARAGLARAGATQISIEVAGRTVLVRLIARGASAVTDAPRGRNVIELWGLPCRVARELEASTDDGNFSKGSLRASVAACTAGGENGPVPIVAVPAGTR